MITVANNQAQEIIKAVNTVGEVVEELAKLGEADEAVVERKSREFLDTIKVLH